jgi:hypothetical protein
MVTWTRWVAITGYRVVSRHGRVVDRRGQVKVLPRCVARLQRDHAIGQSRGAKAQEDTSYKRASVKLMSNPKAKSRLRSNPSCDSPPSRELA